ncbi:hypothetical protein NKI89_31095 [Mesorhizobium sp. M0309]|uniref:PIN-like domain-containing protein n=1 Tax=Mesorhizobium sp. M0309 TaxID=2956933 RepID=UPI003335CF51
MKALVDENLSPALARSLNALFAGEHEIVHIREKFGPGVKDVAWIAQLSTEGALDRHLWRSTHYPELAGGAMFELPIKSTRIEQLKVSSKGNRYTFAFRQPAHHASHCEQNQRSPRAVLTRVAE